MLFKVLSKTVLMGGAGGAVYLTSAIDIPNHLQAKQINIENASFTKSIKTLDDIEMFEKLNNCSFVFIESWPEKTYNFKEFLNLHKNDNKEPWETLVIGGAEKTKKHCKDKKVATLSFWNKSFSLKS